MKCRTAAARRRRQRWGVVFQDGVGGVYGPPPLLDGLQVHLAFMALAESVRLFCAAAETELARRFRDAAELRA